MYPDATLDPNPLGGVCLECLASGKLETALGVFFPDPVPWFDVFVQSHGLWKLDLGF